MALSFDDLYFSIRYFSIRYQICALSKSDGVCLRVSQNRRFPKSVYWSVPIYPFLGCKWHQICVHIVSVYNIEVRDTLLFLIILGAWYRAWHDRLPFYFFKRNSFIVLQEQYFMSNFLTLLKTSAIPLSTTTTTLRCILNTHWSDGNI